MDRGPMALFGAIVAIGLGPAMWLGVQFGQATLLPGQPPAVTSVQNAEVPPGGAGAGDEPTDAEAIRPEPKANTEPLTTTRKARPVTTRTSSSPSASQEPSAPAEESTPPTTPGDGETTPPTESTTPPVEPPTNDGSGEDDTPTQPPGTELEPQPVNGASALI